MKTKVLFIYRVNQADETNHGILLKLEGQLVAMRELGFIADAVCHKNNQLLLNTQVFYTWNGIIPKVWTKLRFYQPLLTDKFLDYDLYILRYGLATSSFINFLKFLHRKNQAARVLIDMPTYPFNQEWQGYYGSLALRIDRWNRNKLKLYVERILHSGPETEIFGVPTIFFSNGVDCKAIPLRKPVATKNYELLAIGKWQYWHGLDRIIVGIKDFIKAGGQGVKCTIVGDGPELSRLRDLVNAHHLENEIRFMGVCIGKSLDDLVNQADLGVGTLGLHRKKVQKDSSLKHREYVARGLPFVMSGTDTDGMEDRAFTLIVPSNDSALKIDELVSYIDKTRNNLLPSEMHEFAQKHLSWEIKMRRLLKQMAETE